MNIWYIELGLCLNQSGKASESAWTQSWDTTDTIRQGVCGEGCGKKKGELSSTFAAERNAICQPECLPANIPHRIFDQFMKRLLKSCHINWSSWIICHCVTLHPRKVVFGLNTLLNSEKARLIGFYWCIANKITLAETCWFGPGLCCPAVKRNRAKATPLANHIHAGARHSEQL